MPSGPKKRKAAKKKLVKDYNNSNSSSTTHSYHGESDGGELSSPAAKDEHNHQFPFIVEKREDDLSQNESTMIGRTKKAAKEEEVKNTGIDIGSKSIKSHDSSSSYSSDDESHVFEKKVVVLESTPVESFPEKIAQEVEYSAMETSDDTLLKDVNDTKNLFLEHKFDVNESASNDTCSISSTSIGSVLVENGAAKLPSPEENSSSESQDNGADHINKPEALQYPDKQALVASAPRAVQTTSWKGCCGIFELFSSSNR